MLPEFSITKKKWVSLSIMMIGVCIIHGHKSYFSTPSPTHSQPSLKSPSEELQSDHNYIFGLLAILFATVTSGFSGVFFEKVLKKNSSQLWLRNYQLSVFALL